MKEMDWKATDGRLICPDEKRARIRASLLATAVKRQSQECRVYELKLVQRRLNKLQMEQLKMMFVEAKWFYNHVLDMHREIPLHEVNTTDIKSVVRLDRDVHAAMNMAAIADLVLGNDLSVPTERREVTLTEFKAAAGRAFGAATQAWTSK